MEKNARYSGDEGKARTGDVRAHQTPDKVRNKNIADSVERLSEFSLQFMSCVMWQSGTLSQRYKSKLFNFDSHFKSSERPDLFIYLFLIAKTLFTFLTKK